MDDELEFAEEGEGLAKPDPGVWKILIADDEVDVHAATKFVLKEFRFKERRVEFLDAYSGEETCRMMREHPDIAVVFLDVVMESDDAGLKAVKRIREELDNQMVRIILRTGQPGHAPEEQVVVNYRINDYKSKAEMTEKKLRTAIISALRSYQDLQAIETSRRGLARILDAASNMDYRSRNLFVSGLLMQLGSLLDLGESALLLIRRGDSGQDDKIMAACGNYDPFIGEAVEEVLDRESIARIGEVFAQKANRIAESYAIYYVPLPGLCDVAIYVAGARQVTAAEYALIVIFSQKIVLALDNYEYVEQSRHDQKAELVLLAGLTGTDLGHALNRGRLARAMAQDLIERGAAESAGSRLAETIERAALLIDIGNHRLPAGILAGAGPLDAAQRAEMRRHPALGAAMIDEALAQTQAGRVMELARQLALTHHEAVDGSGYPNGLRGDGIPLAGRIVAVADGYLAMTALRPWRAALAHAEAVALIRAAAGKRYDAGVVDSFLRVADAFRTA